jgi:hypothetical protein
MIRLRTSEFAHDMDAFNGRAAFSNLSFNPTIENSRIAGRIRDSGTINYGCSYPRLEKLRQPLFLLVSSLSDHVATNDGLKAHHETKTGNTRAFQLWTVDAMKT